MVSPAVLQASATLLAQIENMQRTLEAAEEQFAVAAGLRLPAQFSDTIQYPYRASTVGDATDISGAKAAADAMTEAEFALSNIAAACVQLLPPDYRRRRILWTRLHSAFIGDTELDAAEPLRSAWER